MSRTQNAIRNIEWGMVQKCLMLLMPFMTRTVIIKMLGSEYMGLNSLFTSVFNLLNLAELGFSAAIVSNMYKPIVEHDTDMICALMAYYKRIYHVIGSIVLILGILLLPFLRFFIKGDVPADINIIYLYLIYLFNNCISYFLFAYKNCLFVAHQRNDINSKVQTLCSLLQNGIQILLVVIFRNYYVFIIVLPLFTILNNLIVAHLVDRNYPEYKCGGELDKETLAEIKKRVSGLMLGKISSTVRGALDSLFISAFLGLQFVTLYTNYFYITTAIVGIIQLLESSLISGVGDSIIRDSKEKNYNDYNKFTFILQWIVGWCAICVVCLIQPFMVVWLGKEYLLNFWMPVLCGLYVFATCICVIRNVYIQALGLWWSFKFISIIDIFVNAILNYVLIIILGVYGILLATIIDIVAVSVPWVTYFLFKHYLGVNKFLCYMKDLFKYFLLFLFNAVTTYVICSLVQMNSNILILIFRGLICLIVSNLLYLFFYRTNKYFKEAYLFVKQCLGIK